MPKGEFALVVKILYTALMGDVNSQLLLQTQKCFRGELVYFCVSLLLVLALSQHSTFLKKHIVFLGLKKVLGLGRLHNLSACLVLGEPTTDCVEH